MPRKEKIKKLLKDIFQKNSLLYSIPHQIISEDDRIIATLTPSGKDDDSYFQHFASQYIQFDSCFLMLTMSELKKRISKQDITEYFKNSSPFKNENIEHLERAISAYWDKNYLISSSLFIPMIESTIRELIKNCDGDVMKKNDLGGYDFLTLSGLLSRHGDTIEKIFEKVNHDILFYFKLVLTEKLGMNLRNDFAHGINLKKFSTPQVSDQLFHIMLCLSFSGKLKF